MRAHCINTEDGAIWLSDRPGHHQLRLDTEDIGLTVLGEYEVCLLREACNDWLREHARTDRGRNAAILDRPEGPGKRTNW